eukprot:TRINITY_DN30911_c0_g1_i1.p1 TRINITY_DN30911_c0_g1~~TRINITY_DN30911_c0_g1_i1.p1  ORF type:complete len:297 (+),score=47.96 TRINITY_DN30911_c0_g1_i1:38-892(+)
MTDAREAGIALALITCVGETVCLAAFMKAQYRRLRKGAVRKLKFICLVTAMAVCVIISALIEALALRGSRMPQQQTNEYSSSAVFINITAIFHILLLYHRTSNVLIPDILNWPIKILLMLMILSSLGNAALTLAGLLTASAYVSTLYGIIVISLELMYNYFFVSYARQSSNTARSSADEANLTICKFGIACIMMSLIGFAVFLIGDFAVPDRTGANFYMFRLFMAFDRVVMAIVSAIWMTLKLTLDKAKDLREHFSPPSEDKRLHSLVERVHDAAQKSTETSTS